MNKKKGKLWREQRRKKWREQRKNNGICECGITNTNGKRSCNKCLAIFKQKREKRKNLGICNCGEKTTDGHVDCDMCRKKWLDRKKEKNKILLLNGICIYCQKEKRASNKTRLCSNCTIKHKSMKLWKTIEKWHELFDLFEEQKGTCPYSGLKITIGINAELDHITPRSKGGTNNLENLQWVHSWVNTMKYNKTHQEFVEMIEVINNNIKSKAIVS